MPQFKDFYYHRIWTNTWKGFEISDAEIIKDSPKQLNNKKKKEIKLDTENIKHKDNETE